MRLYQYYHYFNFKSKQGKLDEALLKFGFYKIADVNNKNKIKKIVEDFIANVATKVSGNPSEDFTGGNILKLLSSENRFFNFNYPVNNENFLLMREKFNESIKRSYFNTYLLFCYVLNQYIKIVKDYIQEKEGKKINVIVLPLYDQQKIDTEGLLIDNCTDIAQFCTKDVDMGTSGADSKPKNEHNNLTDSGFQIKQGESWESVLERLAALVKLKGNRDPKKRPTLYISIQKYNIQDIDIKNVKNDFYKNSTKERLIKKFENLRVMFNKNSPTTSTASIDTFIGEIKNQREDFIYIVITSGSPFISDENGADKIIAQSYTVYPKIEPKNRINDQNFNSGSQPNSLLKESFPDVLYFKPEIPFRDLVVSNLTNGYSTNFNNGIFSFRKDKIFIKYKDNGDVDVHQNLISHVINKLEDFTKNTRPVKSISVSKNFNENTYSINFTDDDIDSYFSELSFYHDELVGFTLLKNENNAHITKIQKIIKDLRLYLNVISNGYHYSELLSIVKKSNNIFIGDNNTSEFYNYVNSTNEYNKMLASRAMGFKAELKILGEPGFAFDFSKLVHVFVKVYNSNGSLNYLLTGLYSIQKVKHEISESGSFTTTLSLLFDSAYIN